MRVFVTATAALTIGALVAACGRPDDVDEFVCKADALWPDPWCIPDAGPDAADAGTDADQLIDPGTPAPQSYCSGRCLPEPSDDFAGSWPRTPMLLWVGPRALAPTSCDEARKAAGLPEDVVFFEKYRRFAGLIAPPAACEACTCAMSEGTCTGLPADLEVRAGTCAEGDASSLPFGGPDGWEGACTSANALPSGAQCGGEPCAQSVYASPLPGPTSEACPISSTLPAFTKTTDWETAGVACEAKEIDEPCDPSFYPSTYRCMHNAPLPWLQCVALDGNHEMCPGNYTFARYELYGEQPSDTRGCTACECGGTPVGSACLGTLRLFQDGACGSQFAEVPLSSTGEQCTNVLPAGRALGGKAITDLAYSPGICASTGGDPTGSAERDPAQAVTFCCRSPFDDEPPPPK
ncbi:hypothetical protein [Polyangium fumosum]|uniref:Uncharacterized protein n=1 Tax=Polyangium fumosum TaxID=889272 RepID=A0A4U1JFA6_9BACT|nr:hypothetical protein [Polyangium fumosum]TKD09914.1 hypothetical protein E8A74_09890 [Polyangium fumosum]